MAACLPEQFIRIRVMPSPRAISRRAVSWSSGQDGGQPRSASVSPAPVRIFRTPSTWKSSPEWLAEASASSSPSRSRPARSMAAACSGLFADRGKNGTVVPPALITWVPSGARPAIAPRCRDSAKPDRTTSATTGFTPSCSVKIVMPAVSPFPGHLAAFSARQVTCRAMRAVVQRVSRASVAVNGSVVGAIEEPGLLVLVGVTHDDTPEQASRLAAKLWGLRILDGEKSCSDIGAPLLVISQFTLYADLAKGRRPSWSAAAPGPVAEPLVSAVVQALRDLGARVQTGVFGAEMKVSLVNDGPVTIIIDMERS